MPRECHALFGRVSLAQQTSETDTDQGFAFFCYTLGLIADIAVFKSDMALFKSDMAVFKSDFNT